jgi:hypothetical protein
MLAESFSGFQGIGRSITENHGVGGSIPSLGTISTQP